MSRIEGAVESGRPDGDKNVDAILGEKPSVRCAKMIDKDQETPTTETGKLGYRNVPSYLCGTPEPIGTREWDGIPAHWAPKDILP